MTTKKYMNLQLFAEPTPPEGGEPIEPTTPPEGGTPEPEAKTFTQAELDGILKDRLARASKGQPTKEELKAFKEYQDKQKTDIEKAADMQKEIDAKISSANDRLIKAEIKNLDGYDTKLLSRLVDQSLITVDDNGDVSGLSEQLSALEAEFPMIKKTVMAGASGGANPPQDTKTKDIDAENALRKSMGLPPK